MEKNDFLKDPVKHIDIKSFNSIEIIEAMKDMSFTARDTAKAAEIFDMMVRDEELAATGASIVDMDFFEALGFNHYKGSPFVDDHKLRELYIDRIYDTFIDEEQLQVCDNTIKEIADFLYPRPYSSREFIRHMGKYLADNEEKPNSLIQVAYENDVPIFCPAFSDSSAGFGLVMHQVENEESYVSIDSVKDFRELTEIKIKSPISGLFMIGGGIPKNFAQDTVVCAEVLGKSVDMHKYAVQITVADVRDGACSSSTLKEASSWGKVDTVYEQMVYAEATSVLPLIASYVYHMRSWEGRDERKWNRIFD
jgi:deoxyhypusine synthase